MRISLISLSLSLLLTACGPSKPERQWQYAQQGAYSGDIASDGSMVVLGSIHHGGSLWDSRKFSRRFNWNHTQGTFSEILSSDISQDKRYAATADHRTIVLWDAESGEAIWQWYAPADINEVSLNANGRLALLAMDDNSAALFDIQNGGVLRRFAHQGKVTAADISANGLVAVTGSDDLKAKVWNVSNGRQLHEFEFDNFIREVKISENGRLAFTVSARENGIIWDIANGRKISELNTYRYQVTDSLFLNNDRLILLGMTNRRVELRDTRTGKLMKAWQVPRTGKNQYSSTSILSVGKIGSNYLALGSNGYLFLLKP